MTEAIFLLFVWSARPLGFLFLVECLHSAVHMALRISVLHLKELTILLLLLQSVLDVRTILGDIFMFLRIFRLNMLHGLSDIVLPPGARNILACNLCDLCCESSELC